MKINIVVLYMLCFGILLFAQKGAALPINQILPKNLTGTAVITFDDVAGSGGSGTNYDSIFESNGTEFGERFFGQMLTTYPTRYGGHDRLSGLPEGELRIMTGTTRQNLGILRHNGTNTLGGLGPARYPSLYAIGEGSVAMLFDFDQSEFGFDVLGGNYGTAYIDFFRRDGTLIQKVQLGKLGWNHYSYAFRRENGIQDIAGISIYNVDNGGIGFDNFRHDVPGILGKPPVPEPSSPVPEPSSVVFLLSGIGILGGISILRGKRPRDRGIKTLLILCFSIFVINLFPSSAFALFINGGFETGDFTGWKVTTGYRENAYNNSRIHWGWGNNHGLYATIDDTAFMPGQWIDIDPYEGEYMARLNDVHGMWHATKISQTDTIRQEDIDSGGILQVDWGVMLVEPNDSDGHVGVSYPYFGINLYVDGRIEERFKANALKHRWQPGWQYAGKAPRNPYFGVGGNIYYKHETWEFDFNGFDVGDSVTLEMYVTDCGWGGHGGYAFLDGIGTILSELPDTSVPEPATGLMLCVGFAVLALLKRKVKK